MFSAIIPAYKMGAFIGAALESIGAQTEESWEVIVVDDCAPDDGTAGIVADFARRFPDHRVEFIRHEVNTGVSGARNTAIAAAQGDFLAFLDPDDLWMPTYLARVSEVFANGGADVVGTPPEAFYGEEHNHYVDRILFEPWQLGQFPASLAVGNFLQPSSTVVRRSAVQELGGFDTDPRIQHIEDYDLWIRLCKAGCKFRFINENLTRYRKHEAAATSNEQRMRELHEYLAAKHHGFFVSSQSQIIRLLMRDTRRIKEGLRSPLRSLLGKFFRR